MADVSDMETTRLEQGAYFSEFTEQKVKVFEVEVARRSDEARAELTRLINL